MSANEMKRPRRSDRAPARATRIAGGRLPAIGLEAEFTTFVDGIAQKPEDVFGSPRKVVRGPLVHRAGKSFHLPTGGALYFDTGVMEIATPMIEIAQGCGARGTRSLWENLAFLRDELDAWEIAHGRTVTLSGFSTHYNVSFDLSESEQANGRTVQRLAYLLTHVLATPVMLLAANRRSTGVGVRPRGNRIEITADFTPDAALMAATATLIVGVVREVMRWPDYSLRQLDARGLPVVRGFVPVPHSSRKGWVAKYTCFPSNPFVADVDDRCWDTRSGQCLSLREMASRTTHYFQASIDALGDARSLRLIAAVMAGSVPSLLELPDRPASYDDVGRLCVWDDLYPVTLLPRSRYERVVSHTIARRRVRMRGAWHEPVGVKGWTHVVLRRDHDGARVVRSLDDMLVHLDAWDRQPDRRVAQRRSPAAPAQPAERRNTDRRKEDVDVSNVGTLEVVREADTPAKVADARQQSPLVIVSRV
ncbi:MAG: hypothetical protein JWM95_4530 [Gemmatimonadetes bacterium]|nr:hypothetical protein [Gemmatimonadota bacterium]